MTSETPTWMNGLAFLKGRIAGPGKYVFLAHEEKAMSRGKYVAWILFRDHGAWHRLGRFEWQAVDFLLDTRAEGRIFVLGRDGQVGLIERSRIQDEHLNPGRPVGPTKGLADISGEVHAFGMNREVFTRVEGRGWLVGNNGMQQESQRGKLSLSERIMQKIKNVGGIHAMAQAAGRLHAFGYSGEIWLLGDKGVWSKVDSPTNVTRRSR